MKNLQKGFTLIELLVVIAIIGILSSVVLASLTSARTKGQDAAVQSQLANMRAQAELYYSTTGGNTYLVSGASTAVTTCTAASSVFSGANSLASLLTGELVNQTKDCGASATAWSIASTLPSGGWYCVDSTGVTRSKTAAGVAYSALTGSPGAAHTAAGATVCN